MKEGERRREGRKLERREGLTISHCSTGVFKYHHRVWLRHEGWESSVDQRLFKQLSLSFLFLFFFFNCHTVVLSSWTLTAATGEFWNNEKRNKALEMLKTHSIIANKYLNCVLWWSLPVCFGFAVFAAKKHSSFVFWHLVGVFLGEKHLLTIFTRWYVSDWGMLSPSWSSVYRFDWFIPILKTKNIFLQCDKSHVMLCT